MIIPTYFGGTWNGLAIVSKTRTITGATASFTVPRALNKTGEVAYWLGVGGSSRRPMDLCQAGISVGGNNQDGLIVEDYPTPPLGGPTVSPGDTIQVSIYPYSHWYRIKVLDLTNGHHLATGCRVPLRGGWTHAEFIGEEGPTVILTTPVWATWHVTGAYSPQRVRWLGFTPDVLARFISSSVMFIRD